MAIQFWAIKCPTCGAEVNVENDREFFFCTYCGSKIMINNNNEYIFRNIDDARIKEAETERMVRLKELELEEKESSRGRRSAFIIYGIAILFILAGAITCVAYPMVGVWGIFIGIYIVLGALSKSDDKKKRKRKYVPANEVAITEAMENCSEKYYKNVVMLFEGAGFINVMAIPMNDLSFFTQKKNGQVDSVTINGCDEFEEGDLFPKNSNVLITYHSK